MTPAKQYWGNQKRKHNIKLQSKFDYVIFKIKTGYQQGYKHTIKLQFKDMGIKKESLQHSIARTPKTIENNRFPL